MLLKYKPITTDAQVVNGECYVVGVELSHAAADTVLILYDEPTNDKSAARKFATLRTSIETQDVTRNFGLPGIKCNGVYADWTAGTATLYYYE